MKSIQLVQGGTVDVKGVSQEDYYSLSWDGLTNFGYIQKVGLDNYNMYLWSDGDGPERKNGKNYYTCNTFLKTMKKLHKCYPNINICVIFM